MRRDLNVASRRRRRARQGGLSLVELMVGVAIGLFIVAGATMLVATQLGENRRLLLDTQVQQDLRAAADIITRELRRSGYHFPPDVQLWSPTKQPAPLPGRHLELGVGGEVVSYEYSRPGATSSSFGYSLSNGTIRHRIGSGGAQDLTDPYTLTVTAFTVALQPVTTHKLACPRLCADGTENCWPTLNITDAVITITGQAKSDAAVGRAVISRVRLRNDGLDFNVSATQVCP